MSFTLCSWHKTKVKTQLLSFVFLMGADATTVRSHKNHIVIPCTFCVDVTRGAKSS